MTKMQVTLLIQVIVKLVISNKKRQSHIVL